MDEFESLVQTLSQSNDLKQTISTLHALGNSGDPRALPVLLDVLRNTKVDALRNAAAVGLRELKDNSAVKYLLEQIQSDHTAGNRGTLVYALETLDMSEALPDIIQWICNENYEVVAMSLRVLDAQSSNFEFNARENAIHILQNCLSNDTRSDWREEMLLDAIDILS